MRELQNTTVNSIAQCFLDNTNIQGGLAPYDCETEATIEPDEVSSNGDYKFADDSGTPVTLVTDDDEGIDVDANLRTIVEQVYMAVCHDKEIHRWPEGMENDFRRLTKCSMKSFANLLHGLVECLAKFKRRLH